MKVLKITEDIGAEPSIVEDCDPKQEAPKENNDEKDAESKS